MNNSTFGPTFANDLCHRSHAAPTFKRGATHAKELAPKVRELIDEALTAAGYAATPSNRLAVLQASAASYHRTINEMRAAAVPDVGEALASIIGGTIFAANEGPTPSNVQRTEETFTRYLHGGLEVQEESYPVDGGASDVDDGAGGDDDGDDD